MRVVAPGRADALVMEINTLSERPSRTDESCSTSLDDPFAGGAIADDVFTAKWIARLLNEVPTSLEAGTGRWPQLIALQDLDLMRGTDIGRQLLIAASLVHRDADERRTAEYLLRHRRELFSGVRNGRALLRAARCAAEMDVRRVVLREMPTPVDALGACVEEVVRERTGEPSVAEFVVAYLSDAVRPCAIDAALRPWLVEGVVVALEVAGRHHGNGGVGPSLLAMRPDARPEARLATHLRRGFGDPCLASVIARLLIGGDGTTIDTGVLWWAAQGTRNVDAPATTRQRWLRDLDVAERIVAINVA